MRCIFLSLLGDRRGAREHSPGCQILFGQRAQLIFRGCVYIFAALFVHYTRGAGAVPAKYPKWADLMGPGVVCMSDTILAFAMALGCVFDCRGEGKFAFKYESVCGGIIDFLTTVFCGKWTRNGADEISGNAYWTNLVTC